VTDEPSYELTLFINGASDLSARAITNTRQMCDIHLRGRYHLTVVDIHNDTAVAVTNGVVAAPTLVKNRPLPVRKVVGDLSRADTVLVALEIPVAEEAPTFG
jgi:circadian clock protein KaiB